MVKPSKNYDLSNVYKCIHCMVELWILYFEWKLICPPILEGQLSSDNRHMM